MSNEINTIQIILSDSKVISRVVATFKKIYAIDTNIILQNHLSPFKLSDNGENLIVLTETVLQELDKFKIGQEDINYQAREFNRKLSQTEVLEKNNHGIIIYNKEFNTYIMILKSNFNKDEIENNDDKIISTLENNKEFLKNYSEKLITVSNDILFRTKALLKGFETEPYFEDHNEINLSFFEEYIIEDIFPDKENYNIGELEKYNIKPELNKSFIKIIDSTGKPYLLKRFDKNNFEKVNLKKNINFFGVAPRNLEQRMALELLTSDNDITVIEAIAGTGKTLLALAAALEIIKTGNFGKNASLNSITYIRKTIISGDKMDELGFLPGNLQEKLLGYIFPLKDNIEFIIKNKNKKKKKWTKDELEEAIENFENEFNIEYEYLGHLRGRNLSGIIILDEAQNYTIADITTILSRITEGSKVFILGSIKQIDNPYLNQYNNALTFLMNQCGTFDNVKIQGLRMSKVERGKIVEWIEKITKKN